VRETQKYVGRFEISINGILRTAIRVCPAIILAARRTESAIGRINNLIISIITIKGIKIYGVPEGTKWDKNTWKFKNIE